VEYIGVRGNHTNDSLFIYGTCTSNIIVTDINKNKQLILILADVNWKGIVNNLHTLTLNAG
jgi:hypothetical protein